MHRAKELSEDIRQEWIRRGAQKRDFFRVADEKIAESGYLAEDLLWKEYGRQYPEARMYLWIHKKISKL